MGLFSSSKKSTTVNETTNLSQNAAADNGGFAFNDAATVTVNEIDGDAFEQATDFALSASENVSNNTSELLSVVEGLSANVFGIAEKSQQASSAALGSAFNVAQRAATPESQLLTGEITKTMMVLAAIAAAALVLPKVFGGKK